MPVTINGSAGVITNSGAVYDSLQRGTAVASTSGTSVDFTSIPSWVRRITIMFDGVSLSGTDQILVQLGDSGGLETTGYISGGAVTRDANTTNAGSSTSGFIIYPHQVLLFTLLFLIQRHKRLINQPIQIQICSKPKSLI